MRKITISTTALILLCFTIWFIATNDWGGTLLSPNMAVKVGASPAMEEKDSNAIPPQYPLENESTSTDAPIPTEIERRGVIIRVTPNDTLTDILARQQVRAKEQYALSRALGKFYDLRRLRPGQALEVALSDKPDGNGKRCVEQFRLMVERDVLAELKHVDHASFEGGIRPFQHESRIKDVSGSIGTSFILSARKQGVPRKVFTEFYNMFGARVDFQREIRKGDTYRVVYEENDDSPYGGAHAGQMLYASLTVLGRPVGYYRYTTHDGFTGFFDENGSSVDTRLLKTPLNGGALSSLFGSRKHPVYGYKRMHRGIDFSAPRGTPILAAGDGVVDLVGRYGNYGKYVEIRHGSEFVTGYAHMSTYADQLKPGKRVKQGDVIGFVGSTGLTTGPNLHYEVFRYGKRINPMNLKLPPFRSLYGEELRRFREYMKWYEQKLARSAGQVSETVKGGGDLPDVLPESWPKLNVSYLAKSTIRK